MEATALSVGKSAVKGTLSYAQSAVAAEVALQLGVQRDQAFVRDELEMMQSFLMATHDKRDDGKVVRTWVKQVRDLGYNVEDCLQDLAVRLEQPSWWRFLRTLLDRRHVAKQMKDLRVIAVSGTCGVHGQASVIRKVYDDANKFEYRAWIKLTHPFDPIMFMRNIMRQFYGCSFPELAAGGQS